MSLLLKTKPFSFELLRSLKTSKGILKKKEGWLIHLQTNSGKSGWGEVAPISKVELKNCKRIIKSLDTNISRELLEKKLSHFPASLGFGLGAALAEIDSLIDFQSSYNWSNIAQTAFLLPTDQSLISELESKLHHSSNHLKELTFKWKVGILSNEAEKKLLEEILNRLPANSHLRIDANEGWSRKTANEWAHYLINEKRLEWLEQPLPSNDIEGLTELSTRIPIALDESLLDNPELRKSWKSWQIRRPLLEGDPRILLQELNNKIGFRVISTSFETGIGKRWVEYLATLQQKGPTPTVPGLGIGWCPNHQLFSKDPKLVWEAA